MPVITLTLFYWPTLSGHVSAVPILSLTIVTLFCLLIMSNAIVNMCVGGYRRVWVKLLLLTRESLS